jgi:hypothetical protein
MTLVFPALLIKILSCIPIDRYKKKSTLASESCLLLLELFEVDVLEVLRQLAFYAMIDRPETNNIHKINQTEQKIEEFQYDDVMARLVLSLRCFWHKNHLKQSYG